MTELKKGDKAPDFKGKDQNGNEVSLSDFNGKKVILYFYPKDDTPGCTKEACNLRDNYQALIDKGFAVVGVSADDEASHDKFAKKYNLPFPLIADTERDILNKYDAYGEKNMYGKKIMGIKRKTYVIDEGGSIEEIFKRVKTDSHTEQILEKIEA